MDYFARAAFGGRGEGDLPDAVFLLHLSIYLATNISF